MSDEVPTRTVHTIMAQIPNLLFGKLEASWPSRGRGALEDAVPCRLQVGETAEFNSALHQRASAAGRRTCEVFTSAALVCLLVFATATHGAEPAETRQESSSILTNRSVPPATNISFPKVYSASKWEQPTVQAPSAVSIVTRDEIKKYGQRTLADILQTLSGFHVSYDRNHPYLGVRGFNRADFNNRVLVLVDGHRINNNVSDAGFMGTEFPLDIDLIDRVEVIRGPGSVLYGNNAFFGVINVVTRLGGDFGKTGVEASTEAGSYDTYKGRLSYGHLFHNGVEVLLSGSLYDSRGPDGLFFKEFDSPNQNHGIAKIMDNDQFQSFFGTLSYRDLKLQGAFMNREKADPTAPIGTVFNDPQSQSLYDRSYVTLKFSHEFPVVDVIAQAFYDRNDLKAVYPTPAFLSKQLQVGEWWGAELQLTRRLWEDRITLTGGVEYRDDLRQQISFNTSAGNFVALPRTGTRQSYGLYIQSDVELHSKMHLSSGVRYDEVRGFDSRESPRVALIYNPVESSAIKAIYSTAFRAPTPSELIFVSPSGLESETVTSYELVYERQMGDHVRSTVSGFFNQMDNLIDYNINRSVYQNVSEEARGVELGLESLWANGLRSRVSYTFQEIDDRTTGGVLPDSPKHLGKVNFTLPLYSDKVFAGLEFQYTSKRETWRHKEVSGFGIVNFTLFSQNLFKGMEFSASVYNLLDREYRDPATPRHIQDWFEQNGRTFRVKLSYAF